MSEITEVVREWKASGRPEGSRHHVLRRLAAVDGVYVPSMYDVTYDGPRLVAITPRYPDVPAQIVKRTVADLADWPYRSASWFRSRRWCTIACPSRCSAVHEAAGSARRG